MAWQCGRLCDAWRPKLFVSRRSVSVVEAATDHDADIVFVGTQDASSPRASRSEVFQKRLQWRLIALSKL